MTEYPKPFMRIPELIAMGKSRYLIECDIHSKLGSTFARRAGKGRGVWIIDTAAYAKYEAKKALIDARR